MSASDEGEPGRVIDEQFSRGNMCAEVVEKCVDFRHVPESRERRAARQPKSDDHPGARLALPREARKDVRAHRQLAVVKPCRLDA
jgi:hypothetical protein